MSSIQPSEPLLWRRREKASEVLSVEVLRRPRPPCRRLDRQHDIVAGGETATDARVLDRRRRQIARVNGLHDRARLVAADDRHRTGGGHPALDAGLSMIDEDRRRWPRRGILVLSRPRAGRNEQPAVAKQIPDRN